MDSYFQYAPYTVNFQKIDFLIIEGASLIQLLHLSLFSKSSSDIKVLKQYSQIIQKL